MLECLNSYYAVLEKYPGTPYAEKAEKRANEIKMSLSQQAKEKYGIYDYSIYKYDEIIDDYKVQVIKKNGSAWFS